MQKILKLNKSLLVADEADAGRPGWPIQSTQDLPCSGSPLHDSKKAVDKWTSVFIQRYDPVIPHFSFLPKVQDDIVQSTVLRWLLHLEKIK